MRYQDAIRYDDSGVPQTCRLIDRLLSLEFEEGYPEELRSGLEELRQANERLRIWGCERAYDVESLGSEVRALEEKLDEAREESQRLREELERLRELA